MSRVLVGLEGERLREHFVEELSFSLSGSGSGSGSGRAVEVR